jgi:hypothetical protein
VAVSKRSREDVSGAADLASNRSVEHRERVDAVLKAADESGLLGEKAARVASRVSRTLLEQARERTGIASDSALIEFALANVALADDFAETYRHLGGAVDPDLELGY